MKMVKMSAVLYLIAILTHTMEAPRPERDAYGYRVPVIFILFEFFF